MCLNNFSNENVNPEEFKKKLDSLPDEFYVYKIMVNVETEYKNSREPILQKGRIYKARNFPDRRSLLRYPIGFHAYFCKPKCLYPGYVVSKFRVKKEWLHTIGRCYLHGKGLLCGVFTHIQKV